MGLCSCGKLRAMLQGGALLELAANRLVALVTATCVLAVSAVAAVVRDTSEAEEITRPGPVAEIASDQVTDEGEASEADETSTAAPVAEATEAAATQSPDTSGTPAPPPDETFEAMLARLATGCSARPTDEVGVSDDEITIGQIITDSNLLPQQFRPAYEGLQAFVNLINDRGGICGRRIRLEFRNDTFNPATHTAQFRSLANEVLAFVANESVLDQLDYRQQPPYEPTVRGGGSFVPDVGGLAFSYYRGQSAWHAGVIGSVSPPLVGGGQFKYLVEQTAAAGAPCRKAGAVYLDEPTGASEDQAAVGAEALAADWGGGFGSENVHRYSATLLDSVPAYESMVTRMIADGVNCVFGYFDVQSSINLARAMQNRGVWPPNRCNLGDRCFRLAYIPLAAYDARFIQDAGDAALGFHTFIPHIPNNEAGHPAMTAYLEALQSVPGAEPTTFSILGFASGLMFLEGLQPCREAPTRTCLMETLRSMEDFTAGGLLGGTTPFRTTRATFDSYGTFDWKHIFNNSITMRVESRNGNVDFHRVNPREGFFEDRIRVARGTPG
jgi:ABC-type branched-subunit amino acid transport system substrate-binding protein